MLFQIWQMTTLKIRPFYPLLFPTVMGFHSVGALVVLSALCSVTLSKPSARYSDDLVVYIDGEKVDGVSTDSWQPEAAVILTFFWQDFVRTQNCPFWSTPTAAYAVFWNDAFSAMLLLYILTPILTSPSKPWTNRRLRAMLWWKVTGQELRQTSQTWRQRLET